MRTEAFKKNKTMRTGLILAVVALITLIALAFTFAKYVSEGTGSDNARVAKWGLNIPIEENLGIFSNAYKVKEGGTYATPTDYDDTSLAVQSSVEKQKVVAPGTYNMVPIQLISENPPEVMYDFNIGVDVTETSKQESMISWTNNNPSWNWLYKTSEDGEVVKCKTVDELKAKLSQAFTQKDVPPNTLPALKTIYLGWVWEFEDADKTAVQNNYDTSMGNFAAKDLMSTVTVKLTGEAVQCQGCSPTPKKDPGIVVPEEEIEVPLGADRSITSVTKESTANWNAPSTAEAILSANWNADQTELVLHGTAVGATQVEVSVPENSEYSAGKASFKVVVTNLGPAKEEAKAALAAFYAEKKSQLDTMVDAGFLDAEHTDEFYSRLTEANTSTENNITNATSTDEISEALDDGETAMDGIIEEAHSFAPSYKITWNISPQYSVESGTTRVFNLSSAFSDGATVEGRRPNYEQIKLSKTEPGFVKMLKSIMGQNPDEEVNGVSFYTDANNSPHISVTSDTPVDDYEMVLKVTFVDELVHKETSLEKNITISVTEPEMVAIKLENPEGHEIPPSGDFEFPKNRVNNFTQWVQYCQQQQIDIDHIHMTYQPNQALSYQNEDTPQFFLYAEDGSQVYGNTPVHNGTYYWKEKAAIRINLNDDENIGAPRGNFEGYEGTFEEFLEYQRSTAEGAEIFANVDFDTNDRVIFKRNGITRGYLQFADSTDSVLRSTPIHDDDSFHWRYGS